MIGHLEALLVELTPSDGPFKVGEMRAKGSKEGKGATKGRERQTDGDKKKEVLWCLVYIPQPSCLKYSKICNLYNHPVQMSANNPLSQKQDRSPAGGVINSQQRQMERDGSSGRSRYSRSCAGLSGTQEAASLHRK